MRDYADLILEAQANVTRRVSLLQQRIALPMLMEQFRLQWASLPDEMKEQFKRERPEEYEALMKIQGDQNGNE